jgi:hypothetical protein
MELKDYYFILGVPRTATDRDIPHSPEFSGEGPLPFAITLKLCQYSPMVGHPLHRPSDLRMTHAPYGPPDPRKPHHHC